MTETAQDRGRLWEKERAKKIGGDLVPGSGSGVRKLDVGRHTLLESCKYTDAESIRIDRAMLEELDQATSGAGGVGQNVTAVLTVKIGGLDRRVAIVDLDDWDAVLEQDVQLIPPSKDSMRRQRASVPALFRDD